MVLIFNIDVDTYFKVLSVEQYLKEKEKHFIDVIEELKVQDLHGKEIERWSSF